METKQITKAELDRQWYLRLGYTLDGGGMWVKTRANGLSSRIGSRIIGGHFVHDIHAAWEIVETITSPSFPWVSKPIPGLPGGVPAGTLFMHHWERGNLWAMSSREAALWVCLTALGILDDCVYELAEPTP